MKSLSQLSRADIRSHIKLKYRTAGGTRPDLALIEYGNEKAVVKDFKDSDRLFSRLIGPILIGREYAALSRLRGVRGVPQVIKRIDRYAIMIEHIEGTSLDAVQPGELPPDYFDLLKPIVKNIHKRGVTHCDLRSRGNLMVGKDGEPYVVDFAACVLKGRGLNPFINWLFNQFVLADDYAVLKAKKRLAESLLTDEEKQILATPLPYEERAKKIGEWFRRIIRHFLTKKKH